MDNNNIFTNFGFKKIHLKEKAAMVKNVFDSVASSYDIMNDIMSLGIHRLWKEQFVKMIIATEKKVLLDVGGGTADIALSFIKKGGYKAYVVDINHNMLKVGLNKVMTSGYYSSFNFITANAEELPFKDNVFPLYSTAFCIRNVSNIEKALQEAYRVLDSGGKFFCLEFSNVDNATLAKIYDLWSFNVIPKIGKYIAHDEAAYQYLVESIRNFPNADNFAHMIKNAGFKNVSIKKLNSGIACIHSAEKI